MTGPACPSSKANALNGEEQQTSPVNISDTHGLTHGHVGLQYISRNQGMLYSVTSLEDCNVIISHRTSSSFSCCSGIVSLGHTLIKLRFSVPEVSKMKVIFLIIAIVFSQCLALAPNGLIIPSYFFPTSPNWDILLNSLSTQGVPVGRALVVINANNGVIGGEPDSVKALWRTLAEEKIKGVGKVLCYVNLCNRAPPFPTCGDIELQGARPVEETLTYVDDWISAIGLSNIDGFFLDDTRMDGANTTVKENILNIIKGIRSRRRNLIVVTNPGVAATDLKLLNRVSSTIYDEGPFPDSHPAPKTLRKPSGTRYPKRKFAMILNSVPESQWSTYIETARVDGYFYFYATSGSYAELPPYLDDMLARIAA